MRVVVRAPATIANLGPGFDCLGIAVAWYNEVRVEHDRGGGLTVTAAGEGATEIPRDGSNLVVRAISNVLGEPPGLRVHLTNAIPFGRGFGSSAAAIVAGLVAGRALAPDAGVWDDETLGHVASEMEGHADNVAPCLRGGAVVAAGPSFLSLGAPHSISVIACVAPTAVPTVAARRALASDVPLADAAATSGRAALLAASLATGNTEHLLEATDDVLHQPARFRLMPDSGRIVASLRREGIAAFLAGAGPSVAALVPGAQSSEVEGVVKRLAPDGWDVRSLAFDRDGATVVESTESVA